MWSRIRYPKYVVLHFAVNRKYLKLFFFTQKIQAFGKLPKLYHWRPVHIQVATNRKTKLLYTSIKVKL